MRADRMNVRLSPSSKLDLRSHGIQALIAAFESGHDKFRISPTSSHTAYQSSRRTNNNTGGNCYDAEL